MVLEIRAVVLGQHTSPLTKAEYNIQVVRRPGTVDDGKSVRWLSAVGGHFDFITG